MEARQRAPDPLGDPDNPEAPEEVSPGIREETFVVVPAFEEAECLRVVLEDLGRSYTHVVVVDDGSQDDTWEIARSLARHPLRHLVNRGQGAALQTGIDYALARGARYVVTYDADGQHRTEDIARLLAPLVRGECEVTLGSRFLGEAIDLPPMRWLTLKAGVLFTRFFSRIAVTDTHNGLRGFTRSAAERIQIDLDRMAHASEILDSIRREGLSFREVPVQIRYTTYSLGKRRSLLDAVQIAFQFLTSRVSR